jgi:hypothetical protein
MKIQSRLFFLLVVCTILLAACGSSGVFKDDEVVFAAPGKTVSYSFDVAVCVKGLWATEYLKVTLNSPDGKVFFEQEFIQAKNWDSSLNTNDDTKKVSVDFNVPIPADIPVGTIYTGSLTGAIICPYKGFDVNGRATTIKESMEIRVISAEEVRTRATNNFMDSVIGLLGFGLVISVIYFVGKLAGKNKARYRLG